VDRDGVQDALDGIAADLAGRDRVVAHLLQHVEAVPALAQVLVDRHLAAQYTLPRGDRAGLLALASRECQASGAMPLATGLLGMLACPGDAPRPSIGSAPQPCASPS
jgi:hypothetical protein